MHDAVEKAGLSELVNRLPNGLDTMLEENGKNLSGGERQRVSIARAVIRGATLILADEATSNLDESLGRHVEQTLLSLDATVIAISHRYYEGVTEGMIPFSSSSRGMSCRGILTTISRRLFDGEKKGKTPRQPFPLS